MTLPKWCLSNITSDNTMLPYDTTPLSNIEPWNNVDPSVTSCDFCRFLSLDRIIFVKMIHLKSQINHIGTIARRYKHIPLSIQLLIGHIACLFWKIKSMNVVNKCSGVWNVSRRPLLTLQWRHNWHDGVSNHPPHDCLLNRLLRCRSKKTPKLRVIGLCEGNSPVAGEFPHKGQVTRKMFPFDDVIMSW